MAIKLLLVEDVEDLGRSGDIVNVKPGFARNYILPRKMGIIADQNALKRQARLQEERQKKALQDREEAEKTAGNLVEVVLEVTVKVDHEGHMYGSVSALDIVHLLKEQQNIELEKRAISLKHPIREVGVHKIAIKLKEGVTSEVTLKIVPEDGFAPAEKQEEQPQE